MATEAEIVEVVMTLLDCYSEKKFNNLKGFIETTSRDLRNVPASDLKRAAEIHIEKSRFFPSIAELLEIINKLPVLASNPQVRPLTPVQKADARFWGIFMGDREFCRRIEKFEWYTSAEQCPEEHRSEYEQWILWVKSHTDRAVTNDR